MGTIRWKNRCNKCVPFLVSSSPFLFVSSFKLDSLLPFYFSSFLTLFLFLSCLLSLPFILYFLSLSLASPLLYFLFIPFSSLLYEQPHGKRVREEIRGLKEDER